MFKLFEKKNTTVLSESDKKAIYVRSEQAKETTMYYVVRSSRNVPENFATDLMAKNIKRFAMDYMLYNKEVLSEGNILIRKSFKGDMLSISNNLVLEYFSDKNSNIEPIISI